MTDLLNKKCVPCESDIPPLTKAEIKDLHAEIPEWDIQKGDQGVPRLTRAFTFKNFAEALAFTNAVGAAAEDAGHHPLIELTWGRATVSWWTHNIKSLHQNDFIMAAHTGQIYAKDWEK